MQATTAHVLVVDDVPDTADMMSLLLGCWGYTAEARYCGPSALADARVRPPAAVLLDIGMAPMDGFEFALRFRTVPGCDRVPMVAVSGHTSEALRTRCRAVGIAEYLLKPAEPDVVRTLLAQLLTAAREDAAVAPDWCRRPGAPQKIESTGRSVVDSPTAIPVLSDRLPRPAEPPRNKPVHSCVRR